jgi:GNAT superfamily N-acetyltransferase
MQDHRTSVQIAFRPASPQDFDYCATLYFGGMAAIRELNLDMEAQIGRFRTQWDARQVRVVTRDGVDIGWLQTAVTEDALFLAQPFVDAAVQRQGIGAEVMRRVIAEAAHATRTAASSICGVPETLRREVRIDALVAPGSARRKKKPMRRPSRAGRRIGEQKSDGCG